MSPMYAACTSQMVPPTADLVIIEFVQNDMYRSGGVFLFGFRACRVHSACTMSVQLAPIVPMTAEVQSCVRAWQRTCESSMCWCTVDRHQNLRGSAGRDMGAEPRRQSFERVIRNALAFPGHPAVVVFMAFPRLPEFCRTAENDMLVIAAHYQLPVVSTRCAD